MARPESTARTRVRSFDNRHMPPPGLGLALKTARERAGLTTRLTAYAAGVSNGYVSSLEAGRRSPSASVAEALADVLRLLPDELAILRAAVVDNAGRDHPMRSTAASTPPPA